MKEFVFGIDSDIPANLRLKNGYTMFDWVSRVREIPSFWGRGITGKDAIDKTEVEYLKSKNCRIALIDRDLTEEDVCKSDGHAEAMKAVNAARKLGVPPYAGYAIYAEIKSDWSVSHIWMIRYAFTIAQNGFIPGFIGNTDSSKNFSFDRQCSHYCQSTAGSNRLCASFWATEPKQKGYPEVWEPYCPSGMEREDISVWRRGDVWFDLFSVNENYAENADVLKRMW